MSEAMKGRWTQLAVLVCALAGRSAAAAPDAPKDWATSFGEGRAASYLAPAPVHPPKVLVAAAGRERATATAAAALQRSFGGAAALVMNASALGAIEDLDDGAIIKRAAAVPVDVIAVLRLFQSDTGTETAVVSFYDKAGRALSAFSVDAGTPLPPRADEQRGMGVSAEATSAVSSVLKNRGEEGGDGDTRSPAQREYDAKFLGFNELVPARRAADIFRRGCPYRGTQRTPMCAPELFETLGRDDLARSYQHRHRGRVALLTIGSLMLVAGVGTAIAGGVSGVASPFCRAQNVSGTCIDKDESPNMSLLGGGIGLLGAGIVAIIGGSLLNQYPTSAADIYRGAREHNQALRLRLGLTGALRDLIPQP